MKTFSRTLILALTILSFSLLAACGGGSSSGGIPDRDNIAPVVEVTSPKSGEIVESSNINVIIKFNENIKKPETTNISIYPYKADGSLDNNRRVPLKTNNELSVDKNELTIRPISNTTTDSKALVAGTKYHVYIRGVEDTSGNPMGDCRWEFAIANYDINNITANQKPCETQKPATKAGQFEFATSTNRVAETTGTYGIKVKRVNGSDGTVIVNYQISPDTAKAGTDYTDTTGTIQFIDGGALEQTIEIPILSQPTLKDQPDKKFTVTLTQATNNGTINQQSNTHTVSIFETNFINAQAGTFSFGLSVSDADETITTHNVEVIRNLGGASTVTVTIAATDLGTNTLGTTDYTIPSTPLTFAPNEFSKMIAVTIINDTLVEIPNEQFELSIASVVSNNQNLTPIIDTAKNTHKVTILSEDVYHNGLIDFVIPSSSVAEDSASITPNKVTVEVKRFNGLDGIVSVTPSLIFGAANTVGLADSSDIVTITPTTITFQDQDNAIKNIVVSIFDDSKLEPAETFKIGISTPTGGATLSNTYKPHQVTILASDPVVTQPGVIAFDTAAYSVSEAATSTSIPVIRTGDTSVAQTVTYSAARLGSDTAVLGTNFQQATVNTLTFPAGSTKIQFAKVPIINDNATTGNLTFTVTLSSTTAGTLASPTTKSVTISDVGVPRVLSVAELVAIWSLLL